MLICTLREIDSYLEQVPPTAEELVELGLEELAASPHDRADAYRVLGLHKRPAA